VITAKCIRNNEIIYNAWCANSFRKKCKRSMFSQVVADYPFFAVCVIAIVSSQLSLSVCRPITCQTICLFDIYAGNLKFHSAVIHRR